MAVTLRDAPASGRARAGWPLAAASFVPVGRNGLHDPANAYAHSMGWYEGRLYVGVTRHTQYAQKKYELNEYADVWPVEVPEFIWDADWRARIWRYDPKASRWECVHVSRPCMGSRGFEVPLQVGFRDMQVFQGKSDRKPVLYVTSWGSHMGVGPFILRCEDGSRFEEVSEPNNPWFGAQTLRSLVALEGRLFTAPTGRCGITEDKHDGCMVLVSDDPRRGAWRPACEAFFGDRRNLTVFDMGTFDGHVYAGTMNPSQGFQLWKTDARGEPPYRWTRVLSHGAWRGPLNEGIVSFCEFDGALYIGTGIYNCGYDRTFKVGPGSPELLRVHADDSWDLIVGDPRRTPAGLKVPRSGLGPGFNNPFSGYVWRMCAHDGWLYASTAVWSPWLPFSRVDSWPEGLRRMLGHTPIEDLMQQFGGFDLWRSRDGDHWSPVTRNGFDNPFNIGARTMVSTPHGLFAGTANSFGPKVAVPRAAGWRYETNARGGFEVWLGTHEPPAAAVVVDPRDGALRPVAEKPLAARRTSPAEELLDRFYGGSGFRHIGFWSREARDPVRACDELAAEVLAFTRPPAQARQPRYPTEEEFQAWLARRAAGGPTAGPAPGQPAPDEPGPAQPGPERPDPETILEVDCGAGATTRAFLHRLEGARVTAVAADEIDAALCGDNVPEAAVMVSPLPRLRLPDACFDTVLSVEGPARRDRSRLFSEIHRVLRPGGRMACADYLAEGDATAPPGDAGGYAELLRRCGFDEVAVIDVTDRCAAPFRMASVEFLELCALEGLDYETLQALRAALPGGGAPIERYLLIAGRRPPEAS